MALKGLKASLGLAILSVSVAGCMQSLGPTQRTHMPGNSELGQQLAMNSAARQGSSGHPQMNFNAAVPFAQQQQTPPTGGRFGAIGNMFTQASQTITASLPTMGGSVTTPATSPSFGGPLNPSPDIHIKAAKLHESRGHVAAAVTQYQRAIEIQPENPASWIEFARLYDRAGDLRQASVAYQQAIQLAPNNPTPYNDLGLCYARHGKMQDAIGVLNHAVRLQPERKLYRNNLATILVTANLPDQAIEHLLQAFPPAAANYNIAMMLLQQNNVEVATRFLHQSIRLDANFTPAQDMLAQLSAPTNPIVNNQPTTVSPNTVSPNTGPFQVTTVRGPAANQLQPKQPSWQPNYLQPNNSQARPTQQSYQQQPTQSQAAQLAPAQPPYARQIPGPAPASPQSASPQSASPQSASPQSVSPQSTTRSLPRPPARSDLSTSTFLTPGRENSGNHQNPKVTSPNQNTTTRSFGQHQFQQVRQPNISFPYYNQ
ncbi:MAG: Tfp pilus assembly protein PilF [Pirellulaceae bacterium]|jgi:Tfp pilus assembly protein PilF